MRIEYSGRSYPKMNLQRLVRRFQHFPRSTTVLIASRSISSNQRRCTEYNSPRNDQYIEVSGEDGVMIVEINRPDQRNCVNSKTAFELHRAFQEFEDSEEYGVAVLTGRGGNFCAGYDLKELAGMESARTVVGEYGVGPAPMGPTHLQLSKPVIAAVKGYAVAGGLELALMCDMRVVEEGATFGVFCRRFGVPLLDGGTVRLPQLIGLSLAMDMILTGRPVDAKEAFNCGLANRLVPHGQALSEAKLLARQILSFPQKCLRQDMQSAYHSAFSGLSLQERLRWEFEEGREVLEKESVPGAQRFAAGDGRGGTFDSIL